MIIIEILTFLFFIVIFTIAPAIALFQILKIRLENDIFIKTGTLLFIGLSILTLFSVTARSAGFPPYLILFLPLISVAIFLRKNRGKNYVLKRIISLDIKNLAVAAVLVIGVFTQSSRMLKVDNYGSQLVVPSMHDTMWNVSIVGELTHHFPPQHPGLSGIQLKNHHYFYHLFLSTYYYFFRLNLIDLYFKLSPIFISMLYGLALYAFSSTLVVRKSFRIIAVILGYFGGTFAYVVGFFIPSIRWWENIFLANQPYEEITNTYTILGLAIYLFLAYIIFKVIHSKRIEISWITEAALIIGTLYGFKSFAGILAVASLGLTGFMATILYKNIRIAFVIVTSLVIFIPVFFLITEVGKAGLNWSPGWILTVMVSDHDRLYLPRIAATESFYSATHNAKGLLKIKGIELLLYLMGNLSTRLFGFLSLLWLVFSKKITNDKNEKIFYIFLLSSIFFSFAIPLCFNLSLAPYDIMQFTPYSFVLLAGLTAYFLERVYVYFTGINAKQIGIITIVSIIAVSVPMSIMDIKKTYNTKGDQIKNDEVQALSFLKRNSGIDDIILINPESFKDPMYISALSERRLYLGDLDLAKHIGADPNERFMNVKRIFSSDFRVKYLADTHARFLYVHKDELSRQMAEQIPVIYSNNSVAILRLPSK